jgi:hypothetical protein
MQTGWLKKEAYFSQNVIYNFGCKHKLKTGQHQSCLFASQWVGGYG